MVASNKSKMDGIVVPQQLARQLPLCHFVRLDLAKRNPKKGRRAANAPQRNSPEVKKSNPFHLK